MRGRKRGRSKDKRSANIISSIEVVYSVSPVSVDTKSRVPGLCRNFKGTQELAELIAKDGTGPM